VWRGGYGRGREKEGGEFLELDVRGVGRGDLVHIKVGLSSKNQVSQVGWGRRA